MLRQTLDRILRHHIQHFLVLAALGAGQLDSPAAPFLQPAANQLPVFRSVLEHNCRRDDQGGQIELTDKVAHNQFGAVILGAFHKEMVSPD